MSLVLENHSGWDTEDLRRFFRRGLRAMGVPFSGARPLTIVVTAAPQRSRGCADVGRTRCTRSRCTTTAGRRMSIAIAPPSHFSLRRLSRLFEHEAWHLLGKEHAAMSERVLYSLGPTSRWAIGSRIRYRGRAPSQLPRLRRRILQ